MRYLVIALLFLIACGTVTTEGPPGPPGEQGPAGPPGQAGASLPVAGTRLHPLVYTGDDGAVMPSPYATDIEREERCRPQLVGAAEPGVWRCVPDFAERATIEGYQQSDCAGPPAGALPPDGERYMRLVDGSLWIAGGEIDAIHVLDGGQCSIVTEPGPFVIWHQIAFHNFAVVELEEP